MLKVLFHCLNWMLLQFYYFLLTYAIAVYYVFKEMFQKTRKPSGISDQQGRVAMITGGARGIGLETSKQLLSYGLTVVIVGIPEDQREGLELLRKISEENVYFIECDLRKMDNVLLVSKEFAKLGFPLHVLINNAGIMFPPYDEIDGHESQWAVNYLSHFLLTHTLMPFLRKSSTIARPSRVVNLSSAVHYNAWINFEDIDGRKFYSPYLAYGQTKLAMVLFTKGLAAFSQGEGTPLLASAVHPAVTYTDLYQHVVWAKWVKPFFSLLKTPKDGSDTVIHTALSNCIESSGHYYENCEIATPSKLAESDLLQERLWRFSCNQLSIRRFGTPLREIS